MLRLIPRRSAISDSEPFEPPEADLSGVGIHQLQKLFQNEAIVYRFLVGQDAARIRQIFEQEILRRYQLLLALNVFIDEPFVDRRKYVDGLAIGFL